MAYDLPSPKAIDDPLLGFRFGVYFLGKDGGVYFSQDYRFQSVSGFSVEIQTGNLQSNETSISNTALPLKKSFTNLILKRGMPLKSDLREEIHDSFDSLQLSLKNVLVTILDETGQPLVGYLFEEAYPVKWSLSELDANGSAVIVEEMELSYRRFKKIQ